MPAGRFATCRKSSSRAMCLARADTSNRSRLKGCLCGGLQVPYLCKCSDCTARARCAAHRDDLRHVANRPLGLRVSPGRIRSIARASNAIYIVSCKFPTCANVLIVVPRRDAQPRETICDMSEIALSGCASRPGGYDQSLAPQRLSTWCPARLPPLQMYLLYRPGDTHTQDHCFPTCRETPVLAAPLVLIAQPAQRRL